MVSVQRPAFSSITYLVAVIRTCHTSGFWLLQSDTTFPLFSGVCYHFEQYAAHVSAFTEDSLRVECRTILDVLQQEL